MTDQTRSAALEEELRTNEAERAEVEEAIKRHNGSDRDRPHLRALCQRAEVLGRRRIDLKRQLRHYGQSS